MPKAPYPISANEVSLAATAGTTQAHQRDGVGPGVQAEGRQRDDDERERKHPGAETLPRRTRRAGQRDRDAKGSVGDREDDRCHGLIVAVAVRGALGT
jgi:hypothetical protein